MPDKKQENIREPDFDEELHDVLIAISVVAKRLAQKLTEENKQQTNENGGKDA